MNTGKTRPPAAGLVRTSARPATASVGALFLTVWISVDLWFHPCVGASPPNDAFQDELRRHQGTWSVTASVFDGRPAGAAVIRSIERIVAGDHVVWKRDGKSFAGTRIELDPSREPKAIDVIPDGGRNRGGRVLGIYKLEGDRLTICMAAPGRPRPTRFQAEKDSGWTLRTFSRVPAAGPSRPPTPQS